MTILYYYPSTEEEAAAPVGVEVEAVAGLVTLCLDCDHGTPAQVAHLSVDDAVRLAGALNRAALAALGGDDER